MPTFAFAKSLSVFVEYECPVSNFMAGLVMSKNSQCLATQRNGRMIELDVACIHPADIQSRNPAAQVST